MAAKKIAKNIKFEDALSELEQQVKLLESGELPLEEALDIFRKESDGCACLRPSGRKNRRC